MTVYVDDADWRWRGQLWCHLASLDLDELHQMAQRIGLQRKWFQSPPQAKWPHYDTIARRRAEAIKLGAVPISNQDMVRLRRKIMRIHGTANQ